jgi:hypothetical protein
VAIGRADLCPSRESRVASRESRLVQSWVGSADVAQGGRLEVYWPALAFARGAATMRSR